MLFNAPGVTALAAEADRSAEDVMMSASKEYAASAASYAADEQAETADNAMSEDPAEAADGTADMSEDSAAAA